MASDNIVLFYLERFKCGANKSFGQIKNKLDFAIPLVDQTLQQNDTTPLRKHFSATRDAKTHHFAFERVVEGENLEIMAVISFQFHSNQPHPITQTHAYASTLDEW